MTRKRLLILSPIYLLLVCLGLLSCEEEDADAIFLQERLIENENIINAYIAENNLSMQTDESGLRFSIREPAGGAGARPDTTFRHMSIQYEVRLLPSDTFIDTVYQLSRTRIFEFPLGADLMLTGVEQALLEMGEGAEATLLLPYTLAYGATGNPFLPPFSPVRVDVRLIDAQSDEELIEEYLEENELERTSINEGVYFISQEEGNLTRPVVDSATVTVKYVGRFLDGKVFDSSNSFEILPAGSTTSSQSLIDFEDVIQGWQIGLPLLNEGGKAILGVPSRLAYGLQGQGTIPPYEPLIFEIEVISVEND
ncbi:MAG: FKBP-type peptidyl-prolyl cis-trans isomerase [Thermonemataceae bacterium]